jgi:hypothetical protein
MYSPLAGAQQGALSDRASNATLEGACTSYPHHPIAASRRMPHAGEKSRRRAAMPSICECSLCREMIASQALSAWEVVQSGSANPARLDDRQIRSLSRLGWVPLHYLRDVLAEMLRLGIIEVCGPGRRYMPAAATVPALDAAKGGEA